MGAEQSTPTTDGTSTGDAEVKQEEVEPQVSAAGADEPQVSAAGADDPLAIADAVGITNRLASMEGVNDARRPVDGGGGRDGSSNLALPLGGLDPYASPSLKTPNTATFSARKFVSSVLSWRPAVSSVSARFLPRRGETHTDPKMVFEGLDGLSLQAALNEPARLKKLLSYLDVQSRGDINQKDRDGDRAPLHWAAARGHLRCTRLLLEAGADANVLDNSGLTPARLALLAGQPQAADLIDHGVPLEDTKRVAAGLFGLSIHAALNQPTQLAQVLKRGGPRLGDPNRVDQDGDRRPLHWAAARGSMRCAKLLVEAGAEVGAPDASGKTAMALAADFNQLAMRAYLASVVSSAAVGAVATAGVATPVGLEKKALAPIAEHASGPEELLC